MIDLSRQRQQFSHDPKNGVIGDCYRTAWACVLRVPRDELPHVHKNQQGKRWQKWTERMAAGLGLRFIKISFTLPEGDVYTAARFSWSLAGAPHILCGWSSRGANHSIAVLGPKTLHDPNPADTLLEGPCDDGNWWLEFAVRRRSAASIAQKAINRRNKNVTLLCS